METPIITLVTYNELVTLINSSSLNPGLQYKITDFRTRHYIVDADNNRYSGVGNEITGVLEPLLVTATSSNTIDKEAKSELYPMDIIYYDWNPSHWLNDLSFADADISSSVIISGFTGVIIYRNDTLLDNIVGYDFRNVKFRRWKTQTNNWNSGVTYNKSDIVNYNSFIYQSISLSTNINVQPDSNTNIWINLLSLTNNEYWNVSSISSNNILSSNIYSDFKTFSEDSGNTYESSCRSNHIGYFKDVKQYSETTGSLLSNNVFFLHDINNNNNICVFSNTIGPEFCYNTMFGYLFYNIIGSVFYYNIIDANFISNITGSLITNNIFGTDFKFNNLGSNFASNKIGTNCSSNDFSNRITYNIIGTGMLHNNIGSHFSYNTIANGFSHNTTGAELSGNTIGNVFLMNHIGNNFSDNSLGNNFKYNSISNDFNLNAIGDNFNYNSIASRFYGNIIATNFNYNNIDNGFINNSGIQSGFTNNTGACTNTDFTNATHVYNIYSCTFFKNQAGVEKLQFIDNLDTSIIVSVNA